MDDSSMSSKRQMQEVPNVIGLVMSFLMPRDLLSTLLVCQQWRYVVLQNMEAWCIELVQRKQGFLNCYTFSENNKRNCFLQLYELHKRKLLDVQLYCKLKDELGYADANLETLYGHAFMLLPTECTSNPPFLDFLGVLFNVDGSRNYQYTWYHHLQTLSEDFQATLFRWYAHNDLNYDRVIQYKFPPTLLRKVWDTIEWRSDRDPYMCWDPEYVWDIMPDLKKEYGTELYQYIGGIFDSGYAWRFSIKPTPTYIDYYFPLLLRLCACPEDTLEFFKKYRGGLCDERFDQLIAVMSPEVVAECLRSIPVRSLQVAMLAELKDKQSPDHFLFCFQDETRSSQDAMIYLLRHRRFFITLVHFYKQQGSSPICCYYPTFENRGILQFGACCLEVDVVDVYENLLALLPMPDSRLRHAILCVIRGSTLPPILSAPHEIWNEITETQKQALYDYISKE